jgi:predicted Zn-dependent protease
MSCLGLGLAFEGMGELQEANKWVVSALNINPMNTAALFTLVKIGYARNMFDDARSALCTYISRKPHDTNMLFSLAGVEFKAGNLVQAEQVARQILATDPTDTRTQQFLAQISGTKRDAQASGI